VTNLHLFDPLGEIVKFNSPEAILRSYYRIRLPFYKKRREYQIKFLEREIRYLMAKINFVKGIIDETVHISKRPNKEILVELRDNHQFPPDPSKDEIIISPVKKEVYNRALDGEVKRYSFDDCESSDEESDSDEKTDSESDSDEKTDSEDDEKLDEEYDDIENNNNGQSPYSTEDDMSISSIQPEEKKQVDNRDVKKILSEDYGYLLTMHIWSLTQEKLDSLESDCKKKKEELIRMQTITPKELWKLDLDNLEKEL